MPTITPSEPHLCEIAIVGGGCSGSLVAAQLLTSGFRGRVTVIEPREKLASGLAYSTPFEGHLLNVPAGKMSAFPQKPKHFLEWLIAREWPDASPSSFAPRTLYGEYLKDALQEAIRSDTHAAFSHIRAEAVGVDADENGALLKLSDGTAVRAGHVILAHGNPASSSAFAQFRRGLEDRWHVSPWLGDALRVRFPGERILLVGTGLTAVDAAIALRSQESECQIYMLSRRGILPQVHDLTSATGSAPALSDTRNLRRMVGDLRAHIESARQADLCWRGIVDGLRPHSNTIWHELSVADKLRFLRHLKAYWEPHRHRMAPAIRAKLDIYRAAGALHVIAGRLQDVTAPGSGTQVRILRKRAGEMLLDVDRIITCTGIQESYTNSPRPLIRSLVANGLAQANDLGMGLRTDPNGALLDAEMRPSSVFFTLGPPRRGELFETTAVPEIRTQAAALAAHLTTNRR